MKVRQLRAILREVSRRVWRCGADLLPATAAQLSLLHNSWPVLWEKGVRMSATEAIGKCKQHRIPLSMGSAKFLVTLPRRLI